MIKVFLTLLYMGGLRVIDLNSDNISLFADNMKNHGKVFVAFLAPWCGHCNTFKPEWEETKKHLNSIKNKANGHIITVDDTLMQQLPCKQPSGFPTLSMYEGDEWKEDYVGSRSKDELVEYLMKHMNTNSLPKHPSHKHSHRHRRHRKKSNKKIGGGRKRKRTRRKKSRKKTKRRTRRR